MKEEQEFKCYKDFKRLLNIIISLRGHNDDLSIYMRIQLIDELNCQIRNILINKR